MADLGAADTGIEDDPVPVATRLALIPGIIRSIPICCGLAIAQVKIAGAQIPREKVRKSW
jgi:hypothetical protein